VLLSLAVALALRGGLSGLSGLPGLPGLPGFPGFPDISFSLGGADAGADDAFVEAIDALYGGVPEPLTALQESRAAAELIQSTGHLVDFDSAYARAFLAFADHVQHVGDDHLELISVLFDVGHAGVELFTELPELYVSGSPALATRLGAFIEEVSVAHAAASAHISGFDTLRHDAARLLNISLVETSKLQADTADARQARNIKLSGGMLLEGALGLTGFLSLLPALATPGGVGVVLLGGVGAYALWDGAADAARARRLDRFCASFNASARLLGNTMRVIIRVRDRVVTLRSTAARARAAAAALRALPSTEQAWEMRRACGGARARFEALYTQARAARCAATNLDCGPAPRSALPAPAA